MQPTTPHTVPPTADDDWAIPPDGQAAAKPSAAAAPHVPARSRVAALVGAALLAGGGLGFVVGHGTASTASAAGNTPAAFGGGPAGARGGVAGEQHITGTLSARKGSTITVKSSSGTSATYTVDSTTQIVRNGQTVGLSSLQVGDPVQVHVYPSSSGSTMLVEMVLAGSSATSGPTGGFGGPPSGAAPSGAGGRSGTATTPTTLN